MLRKDSAAYRRLCKLYGLVLHRLTWLNSESGHVARFLATRSSLPTTMETLEPRLLLAGNVPNLSAWPWDVRTYAIDANQPPPAVTGMATGTISLSSNQSIAAAAAAHLIDNYLISNPNAPAITSFMNDIGTARGDANLDGVVDKKDLGILAMSYGIPGSYKWSNGDFNGTGHVDVVNLCILASNYDFTTTALNELPVEAVAHMTPSDAGHTYQMIQFSMPSDATDHFGMIVKGNFGSDPSGDSYLYAEVSGGAFPVLKLWRHAGDALPTLVAGPVDLTPDQSSLYMCLEATNMRVLVTVSTAAPDSITSPTLSYSITPADPTGQDCGLYFRSSRQDAQFSIHDYTNARLESAPANDYAATVAGVPVTINVLGNDTLLAPVPYTARVVSDDWSSHVKVETDGSLTFTPPAFSNGETSHTYQFSYAIHDPNSNIDSSRTGTVTVDVWTPHTLYVDPQGSDGNSGADANHALQTLTHAMSAIDAFQHVNPAQAFKVVMAGGVYNITSPIMIQTSGYANGGHTYPIIITSAQPSTPAVISGGRDLPNTGWTRQTQGNIGVWYVDLPNTVHPFNSLFVNGERAVRAREPDVGEFYYIGVNDAWARTTRNDTINKYNSFHFNASGTTPNIDGGWLPEGKDWSDLGIEVVAYRQWQYSRYQIANVDDASHTVVFNEALGSVLDSWAYDMDSGYAPGYARYYVENFLQGVDTPGEWYLNKDTNRLYYYPKANEINTATGELLVPAVAPTTDQLLVINNASNLVFQDISFEYTDWNLASDAAETDACHVGSQSGSEVIAPLFEQVGPTRKEPFDRATPPAILVNRQDAEHTAGNVIFANNTITHVGGYAMQVHAANNAIIGNMISDCGSGGIVLGDIGLSFSYGAAAIEGFTSHNSISRNTVHDVGAVMADGVPIFATLVDHTRITNNAIWNAGYTGISIGWRWEMSETSASDNVVASNNIHDVMRVLYDGGGIYTLGNQPGTVICSNVIYDIRYSDLQPHAELRRVDVDTAIYLDQGSSGITVYGNLIYNCEQGLLLTGQTNGWKVDSNLFVDIHSMGLRFPSNPQGVEIVTHNVFTWTAKPSWDIWLIMRNYGGDEFAKVADSSYTEDHNVFNILANMTVYAGSNYCDQHNWLTGYNYAIDAFDKNSIDADPGLLEPQGAYRYALDQTIKGLTGFNAKWLLAGE